MPLTGAAFLVQAAPAGGIELIPGFSDERKSL
jgi:hypothetical protein